MAWPQYLAFSHFKNVAATVLTVLVSIIALAAPATAQTVSPAMIVMDMSKSMWGRVEGDISKFEVARDLMIGSIDRWQETSNLGMMSYGHRRNSDCSDIEVVFQPGEANSRSVEAWFGSVYPTGRTPLTSSLRQAAEYLFEREGSSIIVITDGIESCGEEPCELAGELNKMGFEFTIHVVGFDLEEEEQAQLRCLADQTGGQFTTADNFEQLSTEMDSLVSEVSAELESELAALRDELDALRQSNADLEADLGAQRAENAKLVADNARLDAQLTDCSDERSDLQRQLASANRSINDLEASNGMLRDQLASANRRNGDLETDIEALRQQLAASNRENSQLRADNALLDQQLASANRRNSELDAANLDLEQQLATMRREAADLGSANDRLQNQLAGANTKNQGLESLVASLEDKNGALQADFDYFVAQNNILLETIQTAFRSVRNITADVSSLQADIVNVSDTLDVENKMQRAEPDRVILSRLNGLPFTGHDLVWEVYGSGGRLLNAGEGEQFALPQDPGNYQVNVGLDNGSTQFRVTVDPYTVTTHSLRIAANGS